MKEQEKIDKEFIEASKPLIEFMAKNKNPHAFVIVNSDSAELCEGVLIYNQENEV